MPKVAVVIPCYNAERYVGRTLDSVRGQSLTDWECVVVDDGSTDDSANVVMGHAAVDSRIRLIRQPNSGVCHARNVGYLASSTASSYLLFLDADDCLEPDMLRLLSEHLDRNFEVCLAFCTFDCIDQNDCLVPWQLARDRHVPARFGLRVLSPEEPETPFASIFSAWTGLMPSNALLRRSVFDTTPGWDEALGQGAEDTDLFLHMSLRGKVHLLSQRLLYHRRHPTQSSVDQNNHAVKGQRLYEKWAALDGLTVEQRRTVDRARRFRERRVLPYLWLKFGAWHFRNEHTVEGAKCYARALRQLVNPLRQP
jgi:glycosyltransferase involved in cell wall biosynthesis